MRGQAIEYQEDVIVRAGRTSLDGTLTLPRDARSLVIFAHGSGSSRHSPRNRFVAGALNEAGLGTLLFDLLTPEEEAADERTRHLRFDIPMLARRLTEVVDWASLEPSTHTLPIGLFGSSTGSAAALISAAARPAAVHAVVSRGGRPDLAGRMLPRVQAPTLLIVGGRDEPVIDCNREASRELACPWRLEVVPGATHLFQEPGALEQVAKLAADWFGRHLSAATTQG